jgi:hypothetical protein
MPARIKDGRQQFTSIFREVILQTAAVNPTAPADGAGETLTATIAGAALGDLVLVAPPYSLEGRLLYAWVSAANTVSIRLQNETAGAVTDLASADWTFYVFKRATE